MLKQHTICILVVSLLLRAGNCAALHGHESIGVDPRSSATTKIVTTPEPSATGTNQSTAAQPYDDSLFWKIVAACSLLLLFCSQVMTCYIVRKYPSDNQANHTTPTNNDTGSFVIEMQPWNITPLEQDDEAPATTATLATTTAGESQFIPSVTPYLDEYEERMLTARSRNNSFFDSDLSIPMEDACTPLVRTPLVPPFLEAMWCSSSLTVTE